MRSPPSPWIVAGGIATAAAFLFVAFKSYQADRRQPATPFVLGSNPNNIPPYQPASTPQIA
jgi:hypothetical protein